MEKDGMYDKIRTPIQPKRHWKLIISVGICIIIISLAIGGGIWAVKYHKDYMNFVANLSESTNYAYEHNSLRADVDGQQLRISGENAYKIYTYITVYGSGKVESRDLAETGSVRLDYGNGMTLRLWDLPKEEGEKSRMYLLFENADGKTYSYSTDEVSLDSIKVRYLALRNNERWEN